MYHIVTLSIYTFRLRGYIKYREEHRISKTEMKTGDVNPGKLRDMATREARNLNITLNKLKGNPTWELLVDMA